MKKILKTKNIIIFLILLFSLFGWAKSSQAAFVPATFNGITALTTSAIIAAAYPSCPSSAAKIDLYVKKPDGSWAWHNRCYINSANADNQAENASGISHCYYQFPLAQGQATKDLILVRIWRITSDCSNYADEIGSPLEYDDYTRNLEENRGTPELFNEFVQEAVGYTEAMRSRMITIDKSAYQVKIDPHGGTTFEFYNKRSTSNLVSGKFANSIGSHYGGALQVALHGGGLWSLFSDSCGGQGYENPTQAGASCSSDVAGNYGPAIAPDPANPQSGLTIKCDGVLNNNCKAATSKLELSLHRMMNWDYGYGPGKDGNHPNGYPGPYNPEDQTRLAQTTTAYDNYLEYNIQLQNTNQQEKTFAAEIPTYYMSNQFRRYYYPSAGTVAGTIASTDISDNRSGIDKDNYKRESIENSVSSGQHWLDGHPRWITFENTSGLVGNYSITIAWFYAPETQQSINSLEPWGRGLFVYDSTVYRAIKFSNGPALKLQPNILYNFKYVLFPYRYNETIATKYGTKSIVDTIKAMQAEYEGDTTPPAAPSGLSVS